MKKIVSLCLAFVLIFALSVTSFASRNVTVESNAGLNAFLGTDGNFRTLGLLPISQLSSEDKTTWELMMSVYNGTHPNKDLALFVWLNAPTLSYQQRDFIFYLLEKSTLKTYEHKPGGGITSWSIGSPNAKFLCFINSSSNVWTVGKNFLGVNNDLGFLASTYPASVTYFNPHNIDFSSFPISIASNLSGLKFLSDVQPITHNLTINYTHVDGTKAAESSVTALEVGSAYSVASPVIPGYTSSQVTVSGTMPDDDHSIDVIYAKNTHTLTVDYKYADGTQAAKTVVQSKGYNEAYDIISIPIEGYTADKPKVSGLMPDSDLIETVTYSSNLVDYLFSINYVYEDGSQAANSINQRYPCNASYWYDSPAVDGFTASSAVVEGSMPDSDFSVTVTYTKNSGSGGEVPPGGGGETPPDGGSCNWWEIDYVYGNPFVKPEDKPYEGNNPFEVPDYLPFEGLNPFKKPDGIVRCDPNDAYDYFKGLYKWTM